CGASNSVGSPSPKAVGSRPRSADGSPLGPVEVSRAATVPTWRSGGTSGWKSSATGDDAGSETALDEVLSDGPSVIPDPLPIPSPVGCSGCPRRMGSCTGYPAGVDEFLCSGYVTMPERNS